MSLVVALATASCAAKGADDKTQLTVFAASSLTETFTTLEAAFEKDHPDIDVVISFGSSSTLAQQITSGAPAAVIATADEASMRIVADADLLTAAAAPFATNTLAIATPPGNPAEVHTLDDLAAVDFVMCDPSAPCGAAAQRVLSQAGVAAQPRSLEADAKSVLTKVTLGEVDAGLVYVTDARAAGDAVSTVPIPATANTLNLYFIATVEGSDTRQPASAWVSLVQSQAGQRVLSSAGFGAP